MLPDLEGQYTMSILIGKRGNPAHSFSFDLDLES
jgi:hypothetical protein